MVAEQVVRGFWPLWTIVAIGLAVLLTGWAGQITANWQIGLAVVWIAAMVIAAGFGFRRFVLPNWEEAEARVDARLPGRPIAALHDTLAIGGGDGASRAVWEAHLSRMATRSREARAVEPDLKVASRDPFGLRYIALLLLAAAFLFGALWRVPDVGVAQPAAGQQIATGPVWEGWVEPPSYTGRPSMYLADIPEGLLVTPEGSRITIRIYGEDSGLTISETVSGAVPDPEAEAAGEDVAQPTITVAQSGSLAIEGEGGASWDIRMIDDAAPAVAVAGPVEADAMGEMALPFEASDDYAVIAGQAEIALDLDAVERVHGLAIAPEPRDPVIVDLPMPFAGDRDAFTETLIDDFSEHPFANLPVTVTLSVRDGEGQLGKAAPEEMILPGRRFFQPIARAVIEQRRDLLWSRENGRRVWQMLSAVAHEPEGFFPNETTYLRLNFTLRRLDEMIRAGALSDDDVAEITEALWDLAIQLEEGTLADARERLRRAQERLAEAMRNGASDEEIAELMNELRDAMNDYMRMLAEQAEPQGDGTDQPQTSENSMQITQDELQALLDRIQELMEEGRMAEAQELMEQLNQMMENLQVTQGNGEGGPQSPGQQSMQDLAETLRDQQQLSDESFRELQEQFNGQPQNQPGQQGQQGQQPQGGQQGEGQSPGDNPSGQGQQSDQGQGGEADPEGSLADRQQALRDELERQRGNLPALGGDEAEAARDALGRAEGAMDNAEDALREGDLAEAIDQQAEAMNALRDGMRSLGEALAENQNNEPGQGQQEGRAEGQVEPSRRDPLGRQMGNNGQFGTEESLLQGSDVYRRAEEILDEIRRRAGEQERPEGELDYLRRLLERF
ncbi:TIGR02302 family protein [Ponticoccus sp. SC2-23]|nr:TIGR02302 family protein [Alexandriicola marinus]MBM1220333.1 TIGR02302 family protein [Ponticoccus sp. SC6-9]MBM1225019.1 TIGR02302 family protein [Ponticoccus sp. SC6-15]MBM1228533.1 TIGR02302 family protein [Ponticoccus sp. SC6-38]MBM1233830.1 TIGR02302 family protein [Ponticoccus sp. SC6-45]MBM1239034.1 TIGR02302 family protein [Ponticoccus sp. SC6-49]MBM1242816.1 TIGR02302 family protein [Ponticoccus sp. SC2-64]MBM1247354.1 TIGR02302 family protein [Ponticoccus sp. SC6-42]MBM1251987